MQFKYAFSFAAITAFFAACDSTVTNINDDAKAEGTITIKVVDNHSGAALSGVSVYSVVDDEAVIADSLGLSVWKDQALGDHSHLHVSHHSTRPEVCAGNVRTRRGQEPIFKC